MLAEKMAKTLLLLVAILVQFRDENSRAVLSNYKADV